MKNKDTNSICDYLEKNYKLENNNMPKVTFAKQYLRQMFEEQDDKEIRKDMLKDIQSELQYKNEQNMSITSIFKKTVIILNILLIVLSIFKDVLIAIILILLMLILILFVFLYLKVNIKSIQSREYWKCILNIALTDLINEIELDINNERQLNTINNKEDIPSSEPDVIED